MHNLQYYQTKGMNCFYIIYHSVKIEYHWMWGSFCRSFSSQESVA